MTLSTQIRKRLTVLALACTLALPAVADANDPDALASEIDRQLAAHDIPGISVGIIKNSQLLWTHQSGFADLALREPVSAETIFAMGSTSKTVTTVAALQLVDSGLLSLDANINHYLPFSITHPGFPDRPITLRQILTHTSGIRDNPQVYNEGYQPGDPRISLRQFLQSYLHSSGVRYEAQDNFVSSGPGASYEYSNIAFSIAALLVEAVSGNSFRQYTQQSIFTPLNMSSTGWLLQDVDQSRLATPYGRGDGETEAYPQYGYPTYPDGLLRTTVSDYARFMSAILRSGRTDGTGSTRVLSSAIVAEALTPQVPDLNATQGLGFYCADFPQCDYWGHEGDDPGVESIAYFDRHSHDGYVLMANFNMADDDDFTNDNAINEILNMMINASQTLDAPPSTPTQSMWWDRQHSGHGIGISHFGEVSFFAVYSYDSEGQPVWYTAQGSLNGRFLQAPLRIHTDDGSVAVEVGSFDIEFDAAAAHLCAGDRPDARELAAVRWEVEGRQIQWCLEPFVSTP